jgi:hypothetical protein
MEVFEIISKRLAKQMRAIPKTLREDCPSELL